MQSYLKILAGFAACMLAVGCNEVGHNENILLPPVDETPDVPNPDNGNTQQPNTPNPDNPGNNGDNPGNGEPEVCSPECKEGCTCKEGTCVDSTGNACVDEPEPEVCDPECKEGCTCQGGACVDSEGNACVDEPEPEVCDPECKEGCTCKDGACVDAEGNACVDEPEPEVCDPECKEGCMCKDGVCVDALGKTCVDKPEVPPADDSAILGDVDGIQILPMTYAPYTTLQIAHRPRIGNSRHSAEHVMNWIESHDLLPTDKNKYDEYGLGIEDAEGEPWILRDTLLKQSIASIKHKGKSLAYFWQVSDPQIIDEESPCRMEGVTYYPYVTASAYRAQGIYSTHMFDLHVQTARRLSDISSRPFDFALVTGDISDNSQENENAWFLRMMEGGVLNPDTGIDDDPIAGPNNDYNDPFYAKGIGDIPWYPAIGNHDMLYMGFAVFDDKIQAACTGDAVVDLFDYIPIIAGHHHRDGYRNGFQDGSTPDATVVTSGNTPADPARRLLSKAEALQRFYDAPGNPKGHGLDPDIMAAGWGYYSTYPIPGRPIRLITLDTNSGQFSEANMTAAQFAWLETQIRDAKSKNELVIVQSHHGTSRFAGEVTQSRFQQLLASYSGVILHITGHGHNNDSNVYKSGKLGYWEVMLASVVDYPSQSRIFEIVHEGNGYISIYITNIDPNAPVGSFVDLGMSYAAARRFFGMSSDPIADWNVDKEHRNLILRTKVSEAIYKNLEKYEWSDVIESVETLNKLEYTTTIKR